MKKTYNFLMSVAVAAMAFIGCTNTEISIDNNPAPAPVDGVYRQLTFAADTESDASRTHHTGETVHWSKGDRIRIGYTKGDVWQNAEGRTAGSGTAKLYASTEQDSDAELSVFRVTQLFKDTEATGELWFYGLYPSEITKRNEPDFSDSETGEINVYIPWIQSPTATSFDPKADLLVSKSRHSYESFPSYDEHIKMVWTRLVAHGQITLKNLLGAGMVEGEKISFVEFTVDNTVALTGDFTLNIAGQTITSKSDSKSDSKNKVRLSFAENTEYNTLDGEGNFVVWFATAPFKTVSLNIKVGTDKAIYTRSIANANTTFKVNTRSTLGINMASATRSDLELGESWKLMTDASVLKEGKKIVIAAAKANVAMSTTSDNGNNRKTTDITKSETENTITIDSNVHVLSVGKGTAENTWTLYDEAEDGYLYAASSGSNYLKTQKSIDSNGNSYWAISVTDAGIATVKAQGDKTRNWMRYNSSSNIFACYGSGQEDISIYHNATALEQLAKPEILDAVEVEGNAVKVEWNEVPNAIYYTVRCQKENTDKVIIFKNITDKAVVCDNLTNTTNEYPHWIITVTAYADGYYSNTSDAVEVTVEGKTPTVTVEPTELSFTSAGGEKSIEVSTTNLGNSVEIDAVSNNDAFDVSVEGTTVTVVAEANPTTEPRSGIITITARGAMTIACNVAVSQAGIAEASTEWQLLTDLRSLQTNEELEVIIASANSDTDGNDFAMSTTQNSNNRGQDAITKSDDKNTLSMVGANVQIFQLKQGTTEGTWAFFDETYDNGEEKPMGGYLYATSSSENYLRTQAENDDNGSWTITVTDGVALIVAEGASGHNVLRYNSGDDLFSCYKSESSVQPVALYFRKASTEPRILTLNMKDNNTTFKYDGSTELTAIVTTKNASAETLTGTLTNDSGTEFTGSALVGDDNKVIITIKAMPNEANEPRELTFTVSLPNGDSKTVTLTQEAAPLATTGWSLLTDIADLKPGMEVVITANTAASPRILGALSGEFFTAIEGITFSDDKSTITALPADAIIFTIGGAVDAYTFSCDNGLLGSKSSTVNEWNGDNTTWTLTPNEGNVDIVSVGATGGKLQYNTGSPRFKNYTSSQGKVQIYYRGEGSGEFPVAPQLEATPTSLTWEADATDAKQITVTANGDWSHSASGMDWATVSVSGNVITVTPKAANTATTANEGTITISMAGATDIVVDCSQAGATQSGDDDTGSTEQWARVTSLNDITAGTYAIICGDFILLNNSGSSRQAVTTYASKGITITNNTIASVPTECQWAFAGNNTAMTLSPVDDATKYLYSTKSGDGLRISTTHDTWSFSTGATANCFYIKDANKSVHLAVYNNQDWRSYTSATQAQSNMQLYKKTGGNSGGDTPVEPETPATPVLSINPETLSFDAAGGNKTVACTIENEVTGVNVTATESVDWLTTSVSGKTVTITATENTATTTRTATVTIAYTGAESKTVTVNQAAAEVTEKKWVRVTSTDMILSGGTFIIGYEATANSGVLVPMRSDMSGAKTSANGYHYSGTAIGTTTSNSTTINMSTISDTSAYEFTISASTTVSGAINIQRPDGNYIGNNNSKNTARLYTSVSANTAYGVTIAANDVVTLSCAAADTYKLLQYNSGSPRFANYTSGQKNLVIYKLQ